MKRIILLSIVIIGMIGCEKGDIIPPDDPELFTDITYEVIGSGSVEYAEITYGDLKYSDSNNPNLLVWESVSNPGSVLPQSYLTNTCVGHPVKLSAIASGNNGSTLVLKIFDNGVLVADTTYSSNGFLWGGILEYNIPNP
jgi:hypothetical protein